MLLKNYYQCVSSLIFKKNAQLKNHGGGNSNITYGTANLGLMTIAGLVFAPNNTYKGILLGSGGDAPKASDYTMSVISGLTSSNVSVQSAVADEETGCAVTYNISITNSTSAEITVREVGINLYFSNVAYLVEHTLLDEPVTIPAGGFGQVVYTIRMNYPTA